MLACFLLVIDVTFSAPVTKQAEFKPTYCGINPDAAPPAYQPLPSRYELINVQVLTRHGDRTPWAPVGKCWDGQPQWTCDLTDLEVLYQRQRTGSSGSGGVAAALRRGGRGGGGANNQPPAYIQLKDEAFEPVLFRKNYILNRNIYPGNCGLSQLTGIGYRQHTVHGQQYRQAYVDQLGLLSEQLKPEEIYVRSTDTSRTIQSAQAIMLGLYPPATRQNQTSVAQLVDFFTVDIDVDNMTPNARNCPKLSYYQQMVAETEEWLAHVHTVSKPLFDKFVALIPGIVPDLNSMYDCLNAHLCHQLPVPANVTEELYAELEAEIVWQSHTSMSFPTTQAYSQAGIGFFIQDVSNVMHARINGESSLKFVLYSGHDTSVGPFLYALGMEKVPWPPYASHVQLELFKDTQPPAGGSGFAVRLLFNDQPVTLPGCPSIDPLAGPGVCDWGMFSLLLNSLISQDPLSDCAVPGRQPPINIRIH